MTAYDLGSSIHAYTIRHQWINYICISWQRLKKPETESEAENNELDKCEDKEDGDPGDWGSGSEDKEEMPWSFSKYLAT